MSDIVTKIPDDKIRFRDQIHPGGMWSHIMKRHTTLRMIDETGRGNVGALFFNSQILNERYNMPDTLKAQHIARLCSPYVLYSDMGRIMCSISHDSVGWHDTICGTTTAKSIRDQYGQGEYQELRNDFYRNGRDNFLIELGKYGLGKADLVSNVNFFSKVEVEDESTGKLRFIENHSYSGASVDLRFEMDTLVILNTCPHPLDPSTSYKPGSISLTVFENEPPNESDPSWKIRPENERGFLNTQKFYL